jgi:RNA polymerase-binding transcription factor DksA
MASDNIAKQFGNELPRRLNHREKADRPVLKPLIDFEVRLLHGLPGDRSEVYKRRLLDRLDEAHTALCRATQVRAPAPQNRFAEYLKRVSGSIAGNDRAAILAEIRMIGAALARITDGSFGFCVHCGDPIGKNRLEALPHVPTCGACV